MSIWHPSDVERDAARVKFLRENTGIDFEWVDRFCFGNGEQMLDQAFDNLYAAIDAAMKEKS